MQFLASLAFPTLFPDGKGDPTNSAVVSDISNNETQSFAEKLKHLIKFAEQKDGHGFTDLHLTLDLHIRLTISFIEKES